MTNIDLKTLLAATSAGGSSALSSITPLRAAGGELSAIAPAKYAAKQGKEGTYVFSVRFVDGTPMKTVLIDSSQSQSNRIEQVLALQIEDSNPILSRIPRIRVTYHTDDGIAQFTDLELPHRVFDGHIRAGSINGKPATSNDTYRAARNASPANAWDLLNLSPISLLFGAWDATRKAHQGRWAAALTGETVGVLTDQDGAAADMPGKGGARIDPVGMKLELSKTAKQQIADQQKDELSDATYKSFLDAKGKASVLGLGGIPPTLEQLGLISCRAIVRSRVLSFATLRQIRFGKGPEGDAAVRAVLAAIALDGIARADAELFLRAHCHLVEAGSAITQMDQRHGRIDSIELPEPTQADDLLAAAIDHASAVADLDWTGQVLEVEGDPIILAGATDGEADGGD